MPTTNLHYVSAKKELPRVLFYKRQKKSVMKPVQSEFIAFSTNGDRNWGELVVHETRLSHRDDYNGKTLAIDYIESQEKRKGLGHEIIEFAKNYSKIKNCNGYLILKADSTFDSQNISHVFYRKQGFSTLDKLTDKNLDFFVKHHKKATSKDFSSILMFYPPKQHQSIFNKLTTFFKNFINITKELSK